MLLLPLPWHGTAAVVVTGNDTKSGSRSAAVHTRHVVAARHGINDPAYTKCRSAGGASFRHRVMSVIDVEVTLKVRGRLFVG